jgi:hypothetical protein
MKFIVITRVWHDSCNLYFLVQQKQIKVSVCFHAYNWILTPVKQHSIIFLVLKLESLSLAKNLADSWERELNQRC